MIAGRRWPVGAFESLLGHPVLGPLARRLVWGGFDEDGRLVCCFRVAEEGYCVGPQEEACPAEEVHTVGIVHPVYLDEEECLDWREALGDSGQPFPQLDRRVEVLGTEDEDGREITWLAHLGVPSSFFWRLLQKQGWKRGGHDLGVGGWAYVKPFSGGGVTAVLELTDAGAGRSSSGRPELVCVSRAYFLEGVPSRASVLGEVLPLNRVEPAVLSEVLCDLKALAAKGQVIEAPPRPTPLPWRAPPPAYRPVPRVQMVASAVTGVASGVEDDIPF